MPTALSAARTIPATDESARIQTLRGVACLLLVAFHVVGIEGAGLLVDADSGYRLFMNLFVHLRMPLFTFLSGFVYAYRPAQGWEFGKKKLWRLAAPLIIVSTLQYVVQSAIPGANAKAPLADIWRIYFFSYGHFWFLQAMLLIFAAIIALEQLQMMRTLPRFMIVFAAVLLAHFLIWPGELFSVDQAFYLAPFFLAGLATNRFKKHLFTRPVIGALLALFVVTMGAFAYVVITGGDIPERKTVWTTALGISGCFTLAQFTPNVQWLGWIGGFSFTIYLYHVFFTAGTRIALQLLGVYGLHEHFVIGLVMGVAGPIVVEMALRPFALPRRYLLGQS